MELLPLNFPVFYNCIVKGNTPLHQYDAVSILLLGKLRGNCDSIYIRDAEATGYISGEKNIKKEILNQVTRISKEEARERIDGLGFQDLAGIANAARELLTIVNIPFNMRQKIRDTKDDLSVITDTFIAALKCPPKNVFRLGFEEKTRIALCYSKENTAAFMDRIEGKNQFLSEDLDTHSPDSQKGHVLSIGEIEALLTNNQDSEKKEATNSKPKSKRPQISAFSEQMDHVPCLYYYQDNSKETNLFFELTNIALSAGITALTELFDVFLTPYVPYLEIHDRLLSFFDKLQDDNYIRIFYKFTVESADNYRIPDEIDISGIIMIDLGSDIVQDLYDRQMGPSPRFISLAQKLEFQMSLYSELGSIFSGRAAIAISNFIDKPITIKILKDFAIKSALGANQSAIIGIQPFTTNKGIISYSRLIVPLDVPDKLWKLFDADT